MRKSPYRARHGGHPGVPGFSPALLIEARLAACLTQEELGARIAIGKSSNGRSIISRYESGIHVPGDQALNRLAAALGVARADLIDIDGDES